MIIIYISIVMNSLQKTVQNVGSCCIQVDMCIHVILKLSGLTKCTIHIKQILKQTNPRKPFALAGNGLPSILSLSS